MNGGSRSSLRGFRTIMCVLALHEAHPAKSQPSGAPHTLRPDLAAASGGCREREERGGKPPLVSALLGPLHAQPPRVPELGRASAFLVLRFGLKLSHGASCLCGVCGQGPTSPSRAPAALPREHISLLLKLTRGVDCGQNQDDRSQYVGHSKAVLVTCGVPWVWG